MSTSYTGSHVKRSEDGTIVEVHVVDVDGNYVLLKPEIYIERDINPPLHTLPDQKDFDASQ